MKKLMELKEISNYLNQYFLCVQILHDHSAKLSMKEPMILTSMVTQHFSSGSGGSQAVTACCWSKQSAEEVVRKKSRNSPCTSCSVAGSVVTLANFA